MQQFTIIKSFRVNKQQNETLEKLKTYNIDVGRFIREAISEKIKKDYPKIKTKKVIEDCPF